MHKFLYPYLYALHIDMYPYFCYDMGTETNNKQIKSGGSHMSMTVKEMNEKMQEIQEWKKTKEQAEQIISALEKEVIDFLQENEDECRTTNKKGVEILQYIGNICKATYSPQERETVNKDEVKKLLSDEDYQKVSKISRYNVLRIS